MGTSPINFYPKISTWINLVIFPLPPPVEDQLLKFTLLFLAFEGALGDQEVHSIP